MTTDPLTFAQEALGCREFADYDTCIEHGGEGWPCRDALRVADLIKARDRAIRAAALEEAADDYRRQYGHVVISGRRYAAPWLSARAQAIREGRFPAGHGWTPAGRFGHERCKVLLARYPCPYPREEHDPNLPPEDVDFSGRRRKHKEVPDADA